MKTIIKPLSNGRMIVTGGAEKDGDVYLSAGFGEVSTVTIDWTSWLDGASISAVTAISDPDYSLGGSVSVSTASSASTITLTAPSGRPEYGAARITATDDNGRKQIIRLVFAHDWRERDYEDCA